MTPQKQRAAIAEACGWRKWKFGDPWRKGLRLLDHRFNGFLRRVIEDAPANSKTVLLDIYEAWTNDASEIIANYIPASHWVLNDKIRRVCPDFTGDLNAMHEAEKVLTDEQWDTYCYRFDEVGGMRHCTHATATQRAEAFLRTIGKWEESL